MPTTLLNVIEKSPTVFPVKKSDNKYAAEVGLNAAYYDIEHAPLLAVNEKRIWVLRKDLTLATGIKQIEALENTLQEKAVGDSAKNLDPDNRYGHPSLALPEGNYDGSVYYAGWICQKSDQLTVFLSSGRFQNNKLNSYQQQCIEIYIARQLIEAYGSQNIVFVDFNTEYDGLGMFFRDENLPKGIFNQRTYTPEFVEKVHNEKNISHDILLKLKQKHDLKLKKQFKSTHHRLSQIAPVSTTAQFSSVEKSKSVPRRTSTHHSLVPVKEKRSLYSKFISLFKSDKPTIKTQQIRIEPRASLSLA